MNGYVVSRVLTRSLVARLRVCSKRGVSNEVLAYQRAGRSAWDEPGKTWKPITTDELFDIETDIFIPCRGSTALTLTVPVGSGHR